MSRYIVIRCDIGARVLPLRDDFNPRHSVSVAGGFSCRDAGLAPIGSEQSRGYLAASQSCSIGEAPPHRASRLVGSRRCPLVAVFMRAAGLLVLVQRAMSCSRGSGCTCSAGRRTTGVVAEERAGKHSSRLSPRRGLCFTTCMAPMPVSPDGANDSRKRCVGSELLGHRVHPFAERGRRPSSRHRQSLLADR